MNLSAAPEETGGKLVQMDRGGDPTINPVMNQKPQPVMMGVHHTRSRQRSHTMDALILLLVVVGLIAFEVLAMRFGVDSRDRMTTQQPPIAPRTSITSASRPTTSPTTWSRGRKFWKSTATRLTRQRWPHSPCSPTSSVATEPNRLATPRP